MALSRVIRRVSDKVMSDDRPNFIEVLWGPVDVDGFRRVLQWGRNLSRRGGLWDNGQNRKGQAERVNTRSGVWKLETISKSDRLAHRAYLWITEGTAKLKNGNITSDDAKYVEE